MDQGPQAVARRARNRSWLVLTIGIGLAFALVAEACRSLDREYLRTPLTPQVTLGAIVGGGGGLLLSLERATSPIAVDELEGGEFELSGPSGREVPLVQWTAFERYERDGMHGWGLATFSSIGDAVDIRLTFPHLDRSVPTTIVVRQGVAGVVAQALWRAVPVLLLSLCGWWWLRRTSRDWSPKHVIPPSLS